MFQKKGKDSKPERVHTPAVSGGSDVIGKVQAMGAEIAKLRAELANELKAHDALQQALESANSRVTILEGVIHNAHDSVMGSKSAAPVVQTETDANW